MTLSENGKEPTLRIYVGQHCWSCDETLRLVGEVRKAFPHLSVELIDLDAEESKNVDEVFSVPTYVLNGRTISLGNPSRDRLFVQLREQLSPEVVDS